MGGFSLVELLLSLSLGLALSGVMLQGLMAESHYGLRFSRLLRERATQRRTLQLIQSDLAQATKATTLMSAQQPACGSTSRSTVLALTTAAGPVTYSVGAAPSGIWRGSVLWRCGPAYGLHGLLQAGTTVQPRVVIDGLAPAGESVVVDEVTEPGVVMVSIQQQFKDAYGRVQTISTRQALSGALFQ